MDQREFEHWQAVTSSSQYMWVEDAVTRLNGLPLLHRRGIGDLYARHPGGDAAGREL